MIIIIMSFKLFIIDIDYDGVCVVCVHACVHVSVCICVCSPTIHTGVVVLFIPFLSLSDAFLSVSKTCAHYTNQFQCRLTAV